MKKKSKIKYEEPIYQGAPVVGHGHIWITVPWRRKKAPKGAKYTRLDMPSIVIGWIFNGQIVDMHHQSLQ
jgi:hypothetical protein